jgi:hypothetical protein
VRSAVSKDQTISPGFPYSLKRSETPRLDPLSDFTVVRKTRCEVHQKEVTQPFDSWLQQDPFWLKMTHIVAEFVVCDLYDIKTSSIPWSYKIFMFLITFVLEKASTYPYLCTSRSTQIRFELNTPNQNNVERGDFPYQSPRFSASSFAECCECMKTAHLGRCYRCES